MTLKAQTKLNETGAALVVADSKITEITSTMLDPVADAMLIEVTCQAELDAAVGLGKALKGIDKQIVETFAESKSKAHEAHKAVCDLENVFLKPVREATARLRQIVGEYNTNLRRERERAEAEARRKAEAEAAAERERIETEKLERAAALEEQGLHRAANAVLTAAEDAVVPEARPVIYEPPVGHTAHMGTSHTRKVYSANVVDPGLFLAWVLETGDFSLVTPVEMKLRRLAAEMHEKGEAIPGVKVEVTDVPVFK